MGEFRSNIFATVISIILVAVFFANLVLSRDCNLIMIILTGGGRLVDFLGASRDNLIVDQQLYRLISYGYLHPAIWHLMANVYALWYACSFIEKELNRISIILIYHVGLIVPCAIFLLIFPKGYMYGASPAIFCFLGMMAMWLIKDCSLLDEYKRLRGYRYLLCYLIISNLLSLGTFVVHLTGFCVGMLLGLVVKRKSCLE